MSVPAPLGHLVHDDLTCFSYREPTDAEEPVTAVAD